MGLTVATLGPLSVLGMISVNRQIVESDPCGCGNTIFRYVLKGTKSYFVCTKCTAMNTKIHHKVSRGERFCPNFGNNPKCDGNIDDPNAAVAICEKCWNLRVKQNVKENEWRCRGCMVKYIKYSPGDDEYGESYEDSVEGDIFPLEPIQVEYGVECGKLRTVIQYCEECAYCSDCYEPHDKKRPGKHAHHESEV